MMFGQNFYLESSGHTLAVALGFLALYQNEQEVVYQEILDVIGNDREPVSSRAYLIFPSNYQLTNAVIFGLSGSEQGSSRVL